MEPAEPAGRGAGLRRGVPSARVCGRLKGERPSPSPRGEKRGTRTRGTRVSLPSPPGGGASRPPPWRERAAGNSASSRRAPRSPRCAAPRLTSGAAARPLGPRRLRLPACSALSAAPPARGRSPGASGGRAWPSGRLPPSSVPPAPLLPRPAPCGEMGTRGRWRPHSGSLRLLRRAY